MSAPIEKSNFFVDKLVKLGEFRPHARMNAWPGLVAERLPASLIALLRPDFEESASRRRK